MRTPSAVVGDKLLYGIGGAVVLWALSALASAPLNTLTGLKVSSTPSGAQVVVTGTKAPTFTVFRLSDPDRLVVDLSSADATAIQGAHDGQGPVSGVVASQFSDERANVGRVLVALQSASQYDVRADGNKVLISVQGGAQAAANEALAAAPKVASAEPAKPAEAPKAPEAKVSAQAEEEPNVVSSRGDERRVAHPAHRIISVRTLANALAIQTDGQLARYRTLELANPSRVALDVYGVALATKAPRVRAGAWKGLRAGAHADKVRFVLDVTDEVPLAEVHWTTHGLEWILSSKSKTALAQAEPEDSQGQKAEAEIDGQKIALNDGEALPTAVEKERPAPEPAASAVVEVKDLAFVDTPQGGRVEMKLSGVPAYHLEQPDARTSVLVMDGIHLPKRLERSLDTSALSTPVKMVSAFAVPGEEHRVRVVVAADGATQAHVDKTKEGLTFRIDVEGVKTEAVSVNEKTAGFTSEAVSYAAEGAPHRAAYVGKKVSFEFKDIDIHNLLRVIAEISKRNMIVADDVGGRVTIKLRNVPWDQALELILRSKGLGKEEIGNIIRVAPLGTLEREATARAARKAAQIKQEDLQVQLVPVNYAKADELSVRVKDVLSERGTVSVDGRTNVLIVRDIASGIAKARSLVQNLDTPTPQVQIEGRIVEANTTFSRQLGVQWGGNASAAQGTGNPTGLVFPNSVRATGGIDPGAAPTTGVVSAPNWAVNLPAAVGAGSGGALGFVFGSAGGALGLNLRLSALENQGAVKTISAPKVTTLDNIAATISQGVSVPYSAVSAAGVNTIFIEARLSLDVTPHITQDGSILMSIHAQNNQPDPSATGANGQPAIQRKEANTQVLVKDGDTTVIGGIYVRRGSTTTAMVPFLGKIPILGFFFRTDTESENRQELLIFITPRIINRQTIAQGNL